MIHLPPGAVAGILWVKLAKARCRTLNCISPLAVLWLLTLKWRHGTCPSHLLSMLKNKKSTEVKAIFLQKSKGILKVRLLFTLIYGMVRNILEDSLWWGFHEFQEHKSCSPQSPTSLSSILCRWIPDPARSPGACIWFSDCFIYSTTIDFPFCSREKHKAEAKRRPQSFTNCISFDLIFQENSVKSLSVCFCANDCVSALCGGGGDDGHAMWVRVSTYVPECVSVCVPVYQGVWPCVFTCSCESLRIHV